MEPIPETVAAIEELGPFAADADLADRLREMGRQVEELVPDCVGLSVASPEHGVTFTLVAPDTKIALLDALSSSDLGPQAEPGGPGRDACDAWDDLLDERAWQLLAQGSAAPAVASSLTLPIVSGDRTIGTVHLYGGSGNAFGGHHEQLAAILGAWAPGAVTNADLSFSSRRVAEDAPALLAQQGTVGMAARALATHLHTDLGTARAQLDRAARRAGITVAQLAEAIVRLGPPGR
jgi:GAF domain-containing protein